MTSPLLPGEPPVDTAPTLDDLIQHSQLPRAEARRLLASLTGQPLTWFMAHGNDPADPDLSIACIRVVPGAETRLRRFENIQERYVVLEGQGRIELVGPNRAFTEGDHTLSALEPGDVVVIPAGYSRRITNIGPVDLVFLAICTPRFRPAALPDAPPPPPAAAPRSGA